MTTHGDGPKSKPTQSGPKDYEVGYKKPPVKNRFQPGKSGNPSGRRAKRPSPEEYLSRLMARKVAVNESGVPKKITRTEALMHKMFGAAINGNIRAGESIMKTLSKQAAAEATEPKPLNLEIFTLEELGWLEKLRKKIDEQQIIDEIKAVKRKYGHNDT